MRWKERNDDVLLLLLLLVGGDDEEGEDDGETYLLVSINTRAVVLVS